MHLAFVKLKFEFSLLSNKHFYKFAGPQKPLKTHNQTQMNSQNTLPCPTFTRQNAQHPFINRKIPKNNLEMAKDPNGINDSTMSSLHNGQNAAEIDELNECSNQNAIGFHMAAKYANVSQVQQEDSNTKLISYKHDKIKIYLDEEPTCKVSKPFHEAIKKQIKKQAAPSNTQKKKLTTKNTNYVDLKQNQQKTMKPQIPHNQEVEKIIQGKPLRQRFSSLLRDQEKYSIGYSHRRLLKILKQIDTTIEFATMTKSMRVYFLYDLKHNLRDNLGIDISKKEICQLLFIDSDLYRLEWAMNFTNKRYDLLINLPPIKSHDERHVKTRKAIVQYLFAKEVEYLAQKQLQKTVIDTWSPGFNPQLYQIPEKQLPIHPEFKDCEISMDREKILSITNSKLKEFFLKKKDESQQRSMCAKDVQKMIFSKKSNAEIAQRLAAAVKQKEAKMANLETSKLLVDNAMLKQVCQEIMVRYMGRGVSNIPKATLLDLISKKFTGWKLQSISLCLKIILEATEIGYLKQIFSMNKMVICQINKDKFKEMVLYLQKKRLE